MIKSFIFENFKSLEKAELDLESVTSIIGSNSSGKSNAIEGIQILAEAATGVDLSVVLDGTRNSDSHIRGGSSACCRFKTSSFKLGCLELIWMNNLICYTIFESVRIKEYGWTRRAYIKSVMEKQAPQAGRKFLRQKQYRRTAVISGLNIMIKKEEQIPISYVCGCPQY